MCVGNCSLFFFSFFLEDKNFRNLITTPSGIYTNKQTYLQPSERIMHLAIKIVQLKAPQNLHMSKIFLMPRGLRVWIDRGGNFSLSTLF